MGRWSGRAIAHILRGKNFLTDKNFFSSKNFLSGRNVLGKGLLVVAGLAAAGPAGAQTAPTLAGKTVRMIIPFGPGGGYDLWARLVANHIGKHLPGNPTVVPENMPGAGGFTGASYVYNVAPKDGTVIS